MAPVDALSICAGVVHPNMPRLPAGAWVARMWWSVANAAQSPPLLSTASAGKMWSYVSVSGPTQIGKAVQVRRRPVSVGPQDVLGTEAEVRREGLVFVRGELWQALDADGQPLLPGDRVRVEGIDGLTLRVRHVHEPAPVS